MTRIRRMVLLIFVFGSSLAALPYIGLPYEPLRDTALTLNSYHTPTPTSTSTLTPTPTPTPTLTPTPTSTPTATMTPEEEFENYLPNILRE